ncbi:bifunctional hydroxymethylpyrimidine kinase/phosphomethylpyrimidine kinase [Roseomonas fluvialis]|uniref:hydroxymethylpyrimidine kinase n=1 Tax=Roseomonas fluvialis TaxID=1750527 RepID=A0ABM7Y121_9PROT|nr:bifunctional hydroxymethylpyrimidine kinase/phosphomethylpyrimidine kinase [Roseomonas fluvialis]BDG71501.1 hydroxymethylpyrimidine/phosphomethylpyrimidine kinase [Roseomonas fluvialis]
MKGRVLIVAGSDSGGGAGIQADIKAVTALNAFAMTAVTALTAQNTQGVHGVVGVDPAFIRQQMAVVLDDLGADAIKTGMLHSVPVIAAVCDELAARARGIPLVVDPVMIAKGGHPLIAADAIATLKARLLPIATVITPNLPEAEALVDRPIRTLAEMRGAVDALRSLGAPCVVLKGGHMDGDTLTDLLVTADGSEEFTAPRIDTRHTHGTGCTLASAIAAGLAQGMAVREAVVRARAYVQAAIAAAPGYGAGHGPLDHAITFDPARLPR